MGFFQPMTSRHLAEFFADLCSNWKKMDARQRASGAWINPDQPVVLRVPNPYWEGQDEDGDGSDDAFGNPQWLLFHVESYGGGGDKDESGQDVGHQGAELCGMVINTMRFLSNGRPLNFNEMIRIGTESLEGKP